MRGRKPCTLPQSGRRRSGPCSPDRRWSSSQQGGPPPSLGQWLWRNRALTQPDFRAENTWVFGVGIKGHCDHDEEVSHDSGGGDKQEHQKQEELELLSLWEPQEDKFWYSREVPWFHGVFCIHLKNTNHRQRCMKSLLARLVLSVSRSRWWKFMCRS